MKVLPGLSRSRRMCDYNKAVGMKPNQMCIHAYSFLQSRKGSLTIHLFLERIATLIIVSVEFLSRPITLDLFEQ